MEAFDRVVDRGDVAAHDEVCHPQIVTHSLSASMPQEIDGIRRFVANRKATGRCRPLGRSGDGGRRRVRGAVRHSSLRLARRPTPWLQRTRGSLRAGLRLRVQGSGRHYTFDFSGDDAILADLAAAAEVVNRSR